jgi:hypothetical protein
MQMREATVEQDQWLKKDGPCSFPAQRKQVQRCCNSSPAHHVRYVLFVGVERGDVFKDAMRLVCQRRDLMAINLRERARAFRRAGDAFIRANIENLPPESCRVVLVYEIYPYPSGRNLTPS